MTTFYSSSTSERDPMPIVYLREPRCTYPDPSVTGNDNMLYLNYPSSSPYSDMLAYNTDSQESQQNCIDFPVSTTLISQDSSVMEPESVASRIGEPSYNALRDGRSEMFIQTIGGSMRGSVDLVHSSITNDPQMVPQTPFGILYGQNLSMQQANVSPIEGQGLSLSLSTQTPLSSFQYPPASSDISNLNRHQSTSGNDGSCRDDNSIDRLMHVNSSPYAVSNLTSTVRTSKYLKVAQQLLDELVNVHNALKLKVDNSQSFNTSGTTSCKDNNGVSKSDGISSNPPESIANSSSELSPSDKQGLQNKMTKLLFMLDEVDRRYKQYYHQMQIVVSSFDVIAGRAAAKSYTALALQTISLKFRCLRDAINGQLRSTRKSLGEHDNSSSKGGTITRLRYIDQHLRQGRATQQQGMFQQHIWRPQRGLPETSISILRAWMFEHFLHPYPSDTEKVMLARQSGLTRSQISNWFINARVRLWKPMIEDMYKEDIGNTEIDSNSSSENMPQGKDETGSSKEREGIQSSAAERCLMSQFNEPSQPNRPSNTGTDAAAADFRNTTNSRDAYMSLKSRDQRPNIEDAGLLRDAFTNSDGDTRFMIRPMAEIGRYGNGEVSLTLGLQNCDGGFSTSNGQQGFLAVRGEGLYSEAPPLVAEVADYDSMDMADRQNRFWTIPSAS